jgi:hypothetical protein
MNSQSLHSLPSWQIREREDPVMLWQGSIDGILAFLETKQRSYEAHMIFKE